MRRLGLVLALSAVGCAATPPTLAPRPPPPLTLAQLCQEASLRRGQKVAVAGVIINQFEEYYLVESAAAYRTIRLRPDQADFCRAIEVFPSEGLPTSLTVGVISGTFEVSDGSAFPNRLRYDRFEPLR